MEFLRARILPAGGRAETVSSMLEQFAGENNNKTVTDFLIFSEAGGSGLPVTQTGEGLERFRSIVYKNMGEGAEISVKGPTGKTRPGRGRVSGRIQAFAGFLFAMAR